MLSLIILYYKVILRLNTDWYTIYFTYDKYKKYVICGTCHNLINIKKLNNNRLYNKFKKGG